MVRLSELPVYDREHLLAKNRPPFPTQPWVNGPPLAERRVAIVTTAGLHRRGDQRFSGRTGAYRVFPGDVQGRDLLMSHSSVNFDRSGFQQDVNVVFPIDRLRELSEASVIGSVAAFHYSFMGAGVEADELEATAREVAGMLKQDGVNAVFLSPV